MSLFPFIEVSVNGAPVASAFYTRLVSATIHDAPGQEADTVELRFDDSGNTIAMPAKGALVVVNFGFRDAFGVGAGQKMGAFTYEKSGIEGGEDGEFITISGRSADMRSDVKEPLSEHFDQMTVGDIVKQLAGRHGLGSKVDPELAGMKLKYIARYEQSSTDFLTRLADRVGGMFAIKDHKFLLLKRGILPTTVIDKSECESWSFEIEPRPLFGKVQAGWYDRTKNAVTYEEEATSQDGPAKRLRKVFGSADEAKAAAKAEGQRLGRATGSGSITLAGRPDIMADAPIQTTGFRAEASGLWRCGGIDHVYEETYMTTIDLEAPEEGKS